MQQYGSQQPHWMLYPSHHNENHNNYHPPATHGNNGGGAGGTGSIRNPPITNVAGSVHGFPPLDKTGLHDPNSGSKAVAANLLPAAPVAKSEPVPITEPNMAPSSACNYYEPSFAQAVSAHFQGVYPNQYDDYWKFFGSGAYAAAAAFDYASMQSPLLGLQAAAQNIKPPEPVYAWMRFAGINFENVFKFIFIFATSWSELKALSKLFIR